MKDPINIPRFRFTQDEPTPIVRDFNTFVSYIEDNAFTLGKRTENIPFKHIVALNELMSSPNRENTPRTPQQYYPSLHLFYHLALAGGLLRKATSKSSTILETTERLNEFRALSDSSKYFFLLETLWVDCQLAEISFNSSGRNSLGLVYGIEELLQLLYRSKPGQKHSPSSLRGTLYISDRLLILCFPIFGWYDISLNRTDSKSHFMVASLTPSHLGIATSRILLGKRPFTMWNIPSRRVMGEMVDYPGQDLEDGKSEYVPFIEAFRKICEDGKSPEQYPNYDY